MHVNIENLKKSHQSIWLIVDVLMIGLVIVNLVWLIFDSLFSSEIVRTGLALVSPEFVAFYKSKVHPDFVSIDLVFVSIFIFEFAVRWAVAIVNKTYYRWFFYPFAHWYDLLGCIPVGSFRWLRLLRIISIFYRLQQYGIIDFSNSLLGKFIKKYYGILVEEISDRVVENVLNGVQDEVQQGSPMVEKILNDVLLPRQNIISDWLTVKINEISKDVYLPNQDALKRYIEEKVAFAIENEKKVAILESVPVLGTRLVDVINQTVSDVVYGVVDQLMLDLGKRETDVIVGELLDGVIHKLLEPGDRFNEATRGVLIDAIDVIKAEVRVQRWKTQGG
ncbi:ion transporter [Ketobacter sp.]|nr:MAG: ion transporter [Ketobacter sp.]